MARPRNADSERTRRGILAAATRRFGEQGLDGASVRQIASDVGVTFATVHHYFGSKAELFDRCLIEGYARLQHMEPELREQMSKSDGTAKDQIRILARGAFRFAIDNRETSRFLLRATLYEQNESSRERIDLAQRTYLDVASHVLAPITGRTPEELRIPLQGLMFLLTRLAVASERELEIIGGASERVRADLEDYAVDVAVSTLLE